MTPKVSKFILKPTSCNGEIRIYYNKKETDEVVDILPFEKGQTILIHMN